MRAVLTRVKSASVTIDGKLKDSIGKGFLVLLGVHESDTEQQAEKIADKICGLRIFEDEAGKMNKSILETGGEVLCISQFTLAADTRKGNRPSFIHAMEPQTASEFYDRYCLALKSLGVGRVEKGRARLVVHLYD